jgi:hypothetical protein
MKKFTAILFLMAQCVLFAAPVNLKNIAKDAKWVAHVDINALTENEGFDIVSEMLNSDMVKDLCPDEDKMAKCEMKIEKMKKINSFTLYGSTLERGRGVFIYNGVIDILEAQEKIEKYKPKTVTLENGASVYFWGKSKSKSKNKSLYTFQSDDNTVLFASDKDDLKNAIDVINGTKPSLEFSNNDIEKEVTKIKESQVFLTTSGFPKKGMSSKFLGNSTGMTYTMTSSTSGTDHNSIMRFKDAKSADAVLKMVEGFKAYGMMFSAKFPAVKQLIEKHKMELDGTNIKGNLSYTYDELRDWLNVVVENIKDHRKSK